LLGCSTMPTKKQFLPKTVEFYDVVPGEKPWICVSPKDFEDLSQELLTCRSRPDGF